MATSTPIQLSFTLTDANQTQAQLNAKGKALLTDAIKMALPQLNRELGLGINGGQPALTIADVDAASNALLTKWATVLARAHFWELAKARRAQVARDAAAAPIVGAGNELDPVP